MTGLHDKVPAYHMWASPIALTCRDATLVREALAVLREADGRIPDVAAFMNS